MKKNFFIILSALTLSSLLFGCSSVNSPSETGTSEVGTSEAGTSEVGSQTVSEDPEAKTLESLTKLADGIYLLDSYTDHKVEEYLAENIKDVVSFDVWMTNNLTHGVPTGDIPDMGCSSFSVLDPSGNHLFGRNYDMPYPADSLIIRTHPTEGYSSIGIVDMLHINLGNHCDYSIEDEESMSLLFAAPWCICDEINEKGLGISVLELDNKHVVNDTSKPDLLMYSASRVVLDKCASVEEAISLLGEYDIYSPRTNSYHFFVTDITGRSVILEWIDGELTVVDSPAVTNFLMATGGSDPDQRRTKIERNLNSVDSMTAGDAMAVLKLVNRQTRWSAVYNLEEFSVDVCFNADYSNTYNVTWK
ncbi:MAG: linear amide C-N hydrolase [Lachnospiraceae bacterium]|nr:linear amide C-N hydrolase [Lachnospiraceae bacterium]